MKPVCFHIKFVAYCASRLLQAAVWSESFGEPLFVRAPEEICRREFGVSTPAEHTVLLLAI